MQTWKLITGLVMVAGLLGWLVYDLFVAIVWGNEATISRVCLETMDRYRFFGFALVFLLGMLVGHLFLPQHVQK